MAHTKAGGSAKNLRDSNAKYLGVKRADGQMDAADVKRLKSLELENSRLKKLLAESALDIAVLKEINSKKW